jgi:hypothetical protein
MNNPYVSYGAVTTGPPPFRCADAKMWAFFIEADHDKLVALCDDVFNTPSKGAVHYVPITRHVMITFGTMNVSSIPPPYDTMGVVVELHAAFWVYTVAVEKEGPVLVAQHLSSFIPQIFVANPISLAGGREIFGFDKAWGWAELPDPDVLDRFHLDVFGGQFAVGTFAARHPLMTIERADTGTPITRTPISNLEHAIETLVGDVLPRHGELIVPELHMAESIYHQLRDRTMTNVFLKQFRDVANGLNASQQQIVEAASKFDTINVQRVEHEYTFTLQHLDSHPYAEQLGIAPKQTVSTVLEIDADFVQQTGTVLWDQST